MSLFEYLLCKNAYLNLGHAVPKSIGQFAHEVSMQENSNQKLGLSYN